MLFRSQMFYYYDEAKIHSISPTSGPSNGGTLITIKGEKFPDLSMNLDEFMCVFKSTSLNIPDKKTPAKFINSSTILCTSPGGWGAGNIAIVDVSFNGVENTGSNHTYRFFQIDRIWPLSGPASGDGKRLFVI